MNMMIMLHQLGIVIICELATFLCRHQMLFTSFDFPMGALEPAKRNVKQTTVMSRAFTRVKIHNAQGYGRNKVGKVMHLMRKSGAEQHVQDGNVSNC